MLLTIPGREWVEKYKGKFDAGWDVIRERDSRRRKSRRGAPADQAGAACAGIPTWNSLSDEQKKVCARMMEVYAGYLEQTDWNIGRVLQAIDEAGQTENTIVIYIVGDNEPAREAPRACSTR